MTYICSSSTSPTIKVLVFIAPSFIVISALPAGVLNTKLPKPSFAAVLSSVVKNVYDTSSTDVVKAVFAGRVAVPVVVSEVLAVMLITAVEAVFERG